jgi:cytochrome c
MALTEGEDIGARLRYGRGGMRLRSVLVALAVLAASCSGGDGGCEALEPAAPGARLLFDGTEESLARWAHAGPGSFELEEDCTLRTSGGLGLLWYEDEPVAAPATVRVEWMTPGDSNSGVFVGFPAVGDDPLVAVERGYEVQIDATDEAGWTTGAIYGFQPADPDAVADALNSPGSWNTFEIVLDPPEIVVSLNGLVVNRFTSSDPERSDLGLGHVGLQNHGSEDVVHFRRVEVSSG